MCGRYSFHLDDLGLVAAAFGLKLPEGLVWTPRYNVAPTQEAPVVVDDGDGAALRLMRWGLVPYWADDIAVGARAINARIETAAQKPTFRDAMDDKRCVVPATGYFEWKVIGPRRKQPVWIHSPTEEPLWMAGLWGRNRHVTDPPLASYAVVTTAAEGRVAEVHDRMPVLLGREDAQAWLREPRGRGEAAEFLGARRRSVEDLVLTPVSQVVGSPRNDGPECIAPIPEPATGEDAADDERQLSLEAWLRD